MPKWALDRYYQENAFHIRRQTGGPSSRKPEHYTGHYVTQRTIADMTSAVRAGEPFLAFAAFSEPHPPFYPPADHYRRLDLSEIDLPASPPEGASVHPLLEKRHREWEHLTDVEVRQMIAGYHGLVSLMDDYVGQLLSTLEQLGVADETAIILSADHGDQLWEHGVFLKFITREASVRVPLMIHLPGQDGASRDELVEHVDLFPTLCDLAGAPTPETVQGRSLAPLLAGQSPDDWRDTVFSEIDDEAGHITMARTDRWKLNLYDEGPDELFDLAKDPEEFHNLIDEPARADTVSTLRGRIATWRQATAPEQTARR
jgi:arylsulfatase A-like enzyme